MEQLLCDETKHNNSLASSESDDDNLNHLNDNDLNHLNDNDYILYMAQEANFQTRIMFIHAKKFLSLPQRKNDYMILKKCSQKNYKFTSTDSCVHIVDNLLINKLVPFCYGFKVENTNYSEICGQLTDYAIGTNNLHHLYDEDWYEHSIIVANGGFDHVENYTKFKNSKNVDGKSVNIIDGFLIIESK